MAITTLSMVLTVFVLNLHHVSDKPVPQWAKKIIFLYVAPILGMCSIAESMRKEMRVERHRKRSTFSNRRAPAPMPADPEGDERTAIIELQNRTPNSTPDIKDHRLHTNAYMCPLKPKQEAPPVDYSKDWKKMAEVFDRLFFWLFLLAIFISTMVLFHPLTQSYLKKA